MIKQLATFSTLIGLFATLALTGCNTVKNTAGGITDAAKGAVETTAGAAKDAAGTAAGTATDAAKGAVDKAAGAVPGTDAGFYAEELGKDGRIYVFGDKDEHAAFKVGNVGELWVSAISAGPKGETVKFQVSKDEAEMPDRLKTVFNAKHGLNL